MRRSQAFLVFSGVLAICSNRSPPYGSLLFPAERSGSRTNCGTTCRYRIDRKKSATSRNSRFTLICSRYVCVRRSGSFASSGFGRAHSSVPARETRSFLMIGRRRLSWEKRSSYSHAFGVLSVPM